MNIKLATLIAAVCILVFNSPVFAKSKKPKEPSIFRSEGDFIISHAAFMRLKPEQRLEYVKDFRKMVVDFAKKNPMAAVELSKKNTLFAFLLREVIPEAHAETATEKLIRMRKERKQLADVLIDLTKRLEANPNSSSLKTLVESTTNQIDELDRRVSDQAREASFAPPPRRPTTAPVTPRQEEDAAEADERVKSSRTAVEISREKLATAGRKLDEHMEAKKSYTAVRNRIAGIDERNRTPQEKQDLYRADLELSRLEVEERAVTAAEAQARHSHESSVQSMERDLISRDRAYGHYADSSQTQNQQQQSQATQSLANQGNPNAPGAPGNPSGRPAGPGAQGPGGAPTPSQGAPPKNHACMWGGHIIPDRCRPISGGPNDPAPVGNVTKPFEVEVTENGRTKKIMVDPKTLVCPMPNAPAAEKIKTAQCEMMKFGIKVVNGEPQPLCATADGVTTRSCGTAADENDKNDNKRSLTTAVAIIKENPEAWDQAVQGWKDLCPQSRLDDNPIISGNAAKKKDVADTCGWARGRMTDVCKKHYGDLPKCLDIVNGPAPSTTAPAAGSAGATTPHP
ncbi:MAG: hypothetical protein AB7O96_15700 [Pseudobdellovibrionaceae bacterium]